MKTLDKLMLGCVSMFIVCLLVWVIFTLSSRGNQSRACTNAQRCDEFKLDGCEKMKRTCAGLDNDD
jgi:hypothetical protein